MNGILGFVPEDRTTRRDVRGSRPFQVYAESASLTPAGFSLSTGEIDQCADLIVAQGLYLS